MVIEQVTAEQLPVEQAPPEQYTPPRLATVRREQRTVPALGGHVTVRVVGFDERTRVRSPDCDGLGRLTVRLERDGDGSVAVLDHTGDELGRLPDPWNRTLERELVRCEVDGVEAVARATLTGPRDGRDLCVLLGWPGRPGGVRRTA
ncbi:hypothetical protein [Cellulomonas sp. URHB0016]